MGDPEDGTGQIRRAWESFWGEGAPEACWAAPPDRCSFVPFDGLDILDGREPIGEWLRRRREGRRLVDAQWRELSTWRDGDALVWCAELRFAIESGSEMSPGLAPGAPVVGPIVSAERRSLRVLAAVQFYGPRIRFRHLAEAAPAALVEMISDYHAHAAPRSDP